MLKKIFSKATLKGLAVSFAAFYILTRTGPGQMVFNLLPKIGGAK